MACIITLIDVTWNAQNVKNMLGKYTVEYLDTDTRTPHSLAAPLWWPRNLEDVKDAVCADQAKRLNSKAYYGGVGISDQAVVRFNLQNDDRRYPVETVYKDTYERFKRLRINRFEVDVRGDFYDNELDAGEDFTRASMDVIQRLTFDVIRDAARGGGASASVPSGAIGNRPSAAGRVPGYAGMRRDVTKEAEGQHAARRHECADEADASAIGCAVPVDPTTQQGLPDLIEASDLRTWLSRRMSVFAIETSRSRPSM